MTTPAERLKEARRKAGFRSATAAAKAFGWTESTYLGHENGSRGLQIDAALRYARAFRVDWGWLMSGAGGELALPAGGTPVLGNLGTRTDDLPERSKAEIIPVGAEGYNYDELAAFVTQPGPPMDYVIVCTTKGQPIMVGDEVLISLTAPRGRAYETWVVSQRPDGTEHYVPFRGIHPDDHESLSETEFFSMPGLRLEGVVVATYQDRRRRKLIEASGLWPETTRNALT